MNLMRYFKNIYEQVKLFYVFFVHVLCFSMLLFLFVFKACILIMKIEVVTFILFSSNFFLPFSLL